MFVVCGLLRLLSVVCCLFFCFVFVVVCCHVLFVVCSLLLRGARSLFIVGRDVPSVV